RRRNAGRSDQKEDRDAESHPLPCYRGLTDRSKAHSASRAPPTYPAIPPTTPPTTPPSPAAIGPPNPPSADPAVTPPFTPTYAPAHALSFLGELAARDRTVRRAWTAEFVSAQFCCDIEESVAAAHVGCRLW